MPARKTEQKVRSGRFSSNEDSLVIVKVETGALANYRIHNSGPNPFQVEAVETTTLNERCSVDVPIRATLPVSSQTITIKKLDGKPYEGVFDLVVPGTGIRSGRFQSDAATATPMTIIQNTSGLFRVFNTTDGNQPLNLAGGYSGTVGRICSIDFAITASSTASASVTVNSALDSEFQGVYERLEAGAEVRNGRFRHKVAGTAANPTPLKVIDVTGVTGIHRYRITNAGTKDIHEFKIRRWNASTLNWVDLVTNVYLKPDQSFDFQVSSTVNTLIGVEGRHTKVISGIVEYLGPVAP